MKPRCQQPRQATRVASKYAYKALAEDFFYIQHRRWTINARLSRRKCAVFSSEQNAALLGTRRRAGAGDLALRDMPEAVVRTQPPGQEWVVERRGKSQFAFRLHPVDRLVPNPQMAAIKIPDAAPEIVSAYALSDEQALLAKVRYNRLLDIFLGVAAYSLQNHLRPSVAGLGQVEIDEIYVAIDRRGRRYVLPVQAKGGNDRLSTVQTRQHIAWCAENFPKLLCKAISAQFVESDLIALIELRQQGDEIRIAEERHYRLVPADRIFRDDLRAYDS